MRGGSQACPTWGHHRASDKVYMCKVPRAYSLGDLTETRVFSCKFRKKGRRGTVQSPKSGYLQSIQYYLIHHQYASFSCSTVVLLPVSMVASVPGSNPGSRVYLVVVSLISFQLERFPLSVFLIFHDLYSFEFFCTMPINVVCLMVPHN